MKYKITVSILHDEPGSPETVKLIIITETVDVDAIYAATKPPKVRKPRRAKAEVTT